MPNTKPTRPEPRDPTWLLIGYMDKHGRPHLMDVEQSALPWALKNGWSIVLRYRDDPKGPHDIDPAQSSRDIGED